MFLYTMEKVAKTHKVKFIVAGISQGDAILAFAEKRAIPNVDISVDRRLRENTNLPHDSHPSAIANKRYANKLEEFLKAEL